MATQQELAVRAEDARGGPGAEEMLSNRILLDPYHDWVAGEGVPLLEGFAVDLRTAEVARWDRYGVPGAIVDVAGRGDFLNMFLLELPPGGHTTVQRHLFEVITYVISGRGNTVVGSGAGRHNFEWGPTSTFAIPLNESYQLFNASGSEATRIAMVTSLPIVINLFHNTDLVFNLDFSFPDRLGEERHYDGGGDAIYGANKGIARHLWEANFVPDLAGYANMHPYPTRGKNSTNVKFQMADGTMYAHMSEIPVGGYKKAHRHPAGFHIFAVTGKGYSLLWREGEEKDKIRIEWEHGVCYAPPDDLFHQHFNVSGEPARYYAVGPLGSVRYPFRADAMPVRSEASVKETGDQIEPEDEDPSIKALYLEELAKTGIAFTMD